MPLSCEGPSTVFSILLQEREGFKVEKMGNISRRGKKKFFSTVPLPKIYSLCTVLITINCEKFSKRWEYQTT